MEMVLSVDLGFGYVKAVAEYHDGVKIIRKKVSFPSLVKRKEATNGVGNFLGNQDDYLVYAKNIKSDNESKPIDSYYYVGDSAITNSGKRKWTDKGEFNGEDLSVLLGTACNLLIPEGVSKINLQVGLPMNYFNENAEKLFDHVKEIEATIKIGNKEIFTKFDSIEVKPQGVGAYFDIIYDWNGRVRNDDLSKSSLGIIIIGYRTVEYLLAKNGRKGVQFIDEKSGSLEKEGMNKFLSIVKNKIYASLSLDIPKELIERTIFFEDCMLDTKHGQRDITNLVEEAKLTYVSEVVGMIKPVWGADEETMSNIFLGGASAKYLFKPLHDNFPSLSLHGSETETEIREEAHIYSNANGFLKMWKIVNG